ncbi:hypothetical protein CIB84_011712 [Bambusicola thoracicus]|uniref:Uncharacterized protein n=1 Tax=Bambusicola thoracicus TaxID=9083 RepID=A0A2P4SK97_BAMTH|nr:hypothetical protein CIB84_011712 [Bambusicola thoracicus]
MYIFTIVISASSTTPKEGTTQKEQTCTVLFDKKFADKLVVSASNGSRADQFLEQSLSYLRSPQEPLQEVAVRFIGDPQALALLCPVMCLWSRLAGQHLREGHEEKLNDAIEGALNSPLFSSTSALRSLERTSSSSASTLVAENVQLLRTPCRVSPLCYRLSSMWETRLHSLRAILAGPSAGLP